MATVLPQIPRLSKSGKFCGLLSRVMLNCSCECRAGHPTCGREATSETCNALRRGRRRQSLHGACWQLFGLYYKSRLQSGWCPQAPNTDMFINKRAQMEKIWKVWEGNKGRNKQISLKWSKEHLKWQMVCTDFVVPLKGTKRLMSHGCVHILNSPTGHKYKLLLPVASNKYYYTTISNQLAQQQKVLGAVQTCSK